MATRQYIGARYIPVFADPVQWSSDNAYSYLTMVQNAGETFMSKQAVPAGIDLPDVSQGEESNEYWVHMSNWNAQVEQYRQEVLQYNSRISTLEDDLPIADFDSTNTVSAAIGAINDKIGTGFDATDNIAAVIGTGFDATDNIAAVIGTGFDATDNIAAVIGAGFDATDNIAAVIGAGFDADSTVKAAIEETESKIELVNSTIDNYLHQSYLGRIPYTLESIYDGYHSPQAMCLLDDHTVLAALSNSTTDNSCMVVKINLNTSEITNRYSSVFAHCNGMAYNPITNKLYVTPCYDYTDSMSSIEKIYVCNPSTMYVEEEIAVDFLPHGIGYDKVTEKMYVTDQDEPNAPNVYEFDYVNKTCTLICTVPEPTIANYKYSSVLGHQDIKAYNGKLYYTMGGELEDLIVVFETDGTLIKYLNLDKNIFIYNSYELEGTDFNSNGDLITFSKCVLATEGRYGVIACINVSGKCVYDSKYNSVYGGTNDTAYCDATTSNFRALGNDTAPFNHVSEAIAFAELTKSNLVMLNASGTYRFYPRDIGQLQNIEIRGASTSAIAEVPANHYFGNNCFFSGCGFQCYGTGNHMIRAGYGVAKFVNVKFNKTTSDNFSLSTSAIVIIDGCSTDGNAMAVNCGNRGNALASNLTNITVTNAHAWSA